MNNQFVSDYIQQCVKNGIDNPKDICDAVREEIAEIDAKLHDADGLRIRKLDLHQVLITYGSNSLKRTNLETNLDEESDEAKQIYAKICDVIDQYGSMTNREIIQKVGSYQEDMKVIRAIKWLGERQIIARDGTLDNKLIRGSNWDARPKDVE